MTDELPPHVTVWIEREGLEPLGRVPLTTARRAVREALATMQDARRFADSVASALADRGFLDPCSDASQRIHHLRDETLGGGWVVATPIVELLRSAPTHTERRGPRPDILPAGEDRHGGTLVLREGAAHLDLRYDDDGLCSGTVAGGGDLFRATWQANELPPSIDPRARPPSEPPLSLLCADRVEDLPRDPVALGQRFATGQQTRRVPARLRLPLRLPGGSDGVRRRAIRCLRTALFDGVLAEIDPEARFAVVDGLDGSALARGATAEEALDRWQRALFRHRPRPPEAPKPVKVEQEAGPEPDDAPREERREDGTMVFSTGTVRVNAPAGPGVPWPEFRPDTTPGVLVPLAPPVSLDALPRAFVDAGFTRWLQVVGERGHVDHVLAREDERGYTLLGRHVLDVVDVQTLDEQIALATARASVHEELDMPDPWHDPRYRVALHQYRCFDDATRSPIPCAQTSAQFSRSLTAADIDGDRAPWRVTRLVALG